MIKKIKKLFLKITNWLAYKLPLDHSEITEGYADTNEIFLVNNKRVFIPKGSLAIWGDSVTRNTKFE